MRQQTVPVCTVQALHQPLLHQPLHTAWFVSLHCRIVFGFRSTVKDNLHYTDDGSYLYPAGHNVVIVSADGKSHKFVSGSPECEGITAIMLSPNKKLLAVAERADKAVISVYDMQTLKRRKQLLAADVGSKASTSWWIVCP